MLTSCVNLYVITKNYLTEDELKTLNRMVSAFFDLAELRAMQHKPMYIKDWVEELDKFVQNYGKGILQNAGMVSHKTALAKAEQEYEKYRERTINKLSSAERDYLSTLKQAQKQIEKK